MLPNKTNNFNFIRLMLALLVLLAHAFELIDGDAHRELLTRVFHNTMTFGSFAVAGFFILSGYLISKSWMNQPAVLPYLEKRIRRIFPAFIVASVICALIVGPLGAASVSTYFSNFHPLDFLWGMVRLRQPAVPDVFVGQPWPLVNGAMWTIPIEFACYIGVMAIGLLGGLKRLPGVAIVALLLGICLVDRSGHDIVWVKQYELLLALYFAIGSCFHLFRDRIRYTPTYAVIAAAALAYGLLSYRGIVLVFPFACAYLLFFFAFAKIPLLANFGKLPDVSYGAYLYGWPSQKLLLWWFPHSSPWVVFMGSALMALAAGWASWHLVEKRFMHARNDQRVPQAKLAV